MEKENNTLKQGWEPLHFAGLGLILGGALGSLIGSLFVEDLTWGGIVGAAAGLILGSVLDTYTEKDTMEGTPAEPILGIRLIAYLYFLGAAVLLLALPFNHQKISQQIASLHALPALGGIPFLILVSGVGILIGYGLYKMTGWGYWLTLGYLMYLFIAPHLLGNNVTSIFGNIIWPLSAGVYLILNRKDYFQVIRFRNQNPTSV
jgi:hypothetical protein